MKRIPGILITMLIVSAIPTLRQAIWTAYPSGDRIREETVQTASAGEADPMGTSPWVLVRITVPGFTAPHIARALELGFHPATEEPPASRFFDIALPRDRLTELGEEGWQYEVRKVIEPPFHTTFGGIDLPVPQIDPEYHSYEEMTRELDSLFQANPEIAFMESLGVSTLDRRVIWGFKVSDNVETNEDEPAVLFVSTHHGCEMIGMEYCLFLIDSLLTGYEIDPRVTQWVNETEIWFVPLFNPDGYWAVYTDLNHQWRKNANDTNGNGIYYEFADTFWTSNHDGVDLNRNYSFNWETGGSGDPQSSHFRGEAPFSEDENRSMQTLATRENFQMAITFHSWGEVVIYPWDSDWNNELSPDIEVISDIADSVANRTPAQDGTGTYYPYAGSATQGYIDNWVYGDLGTICMTIEVNPYPIFIAPGDSIQSIIHRIFPGPTYLLDRVHASGVTGLVTDQLTGLPVQAEVRLLEYYADYLLPRISDPTTGRYYRYLLPGRLYSLEFISDGYDTARVDRLVAHPDSLTTVNVELTPYVGIHEKDPAGHIEIRTSSVSQNYPNPFNPSTTIAFEIPGSDGSRYDVSLMIYDLRGKRVRTLADAKFEAGRHHVVWDGRDDRGAAVTSGVYIYTLKAGEKRTSRKMTVLR